MSKRIPHFFEKQSRGFKPVCPIAPILIVILSSSYGFTDNIDSLPLKGDPQLLLALLDAQATNSASFAAGSAKVFVTYSRSNPDVTFSYTETIKWRDDSVTLEIRFYDPRGVLFGIRQPNTNVEDQPALTMLVNTNMCYIYNYDDSVVRISRVTPVDRVKWLFVSVPQDWFMFPPPALAAGRPWSQIISVPSVHRDKLDHCELTDQGKGIYEYSRHDRDGGLLKAIFSGKNCLNITQYHYVSKTQNITGEYVWKNTINNKCILDTHTYRSDAPDGHKEMYKLHVIEFTDVPPASAEFARSSFLARIPKSVTVDDGPGNRRFHLSRNTSKEIDIFLKKHLESIRNGSLMHK